MSNFPLELSCQAVHQLRETGQSHLLLDVRNADEVAVAAIAGAAWIPMGELVERVGELAGAEEGRVVVYCHLGVRSLRVARWLRENGFPNAQSMAGGIEQWAEEIEPGMGRY